MAAVTPAAVIRVDGDVEHQAGDRLPLGGDEDADRVGTLEGDHAAAGPEVHLPAQPLHVVHRQAPGSSAGADVAAFVRVDDEGHVVRTAETVGGHTVTPSA